MSAAELLMGEIVKAATAAREALGAPSSEQLDDAAKRVAAERDALRAQLDSARADVERLTAALANEADEQTFLKLAAKSAEDARDAARADVARLRGLVKQATDFARRHRCGLACDCKSAQDRMERLARIDAEGT